MIPRLGEGDVAPKSPRREYQQPVEQLLSALCILEPPFLQSIFTLRSQLTLDVHSFDTMSRSRSPSKAYRRCPAAHA